MLAGPLTSLWRCQLDCLLLSFTRNAYLSCARWFLRGECLRVSWGTCWGHTQLPWDGMVAGRAVQARSIETRLGDSSEHSRLHHWNLIWNLGKGRGENWSPNGFTSHIYQLPAILTETYKSRKNHVKVNVSAETLCNRTWSDSTCWALSGDCTTDKLMRAGFEMCLAPDWGWHTCILTVYSLEIISHRQACTGLILFTVMQLAQEHESTQTV